MQRLQHFGCTNAFTRVSQCIYSFSHFWAISSTYHQSSLRQNSPSLPRRHPPSYAKVSRKLISCPPPLARHESSDTNYSYLLGSGGTLMFDITIVAQSFIYRPKPFTRGRRISRTVNEEEAGLLSAGATGAEDPTTPSRRRLPTNDSDRVADS